MLLILLLLIPIAGLFLITTTMSNDNTYSNLKQIKVTGLVTSLINMFVSLIVFIFFNFSSNQFQFLQEYHKVSSFDFYLGVDGISIYFVILTTILMPIALLSN
jgi:NADH:ubiquinone oxidoreductase subunit 4 (subunit M)